MSHNHSLKRKNRALTIENTSHPVPFHAFEEHAHEGFPP